MLSLMYVHPCFHVDYPLISSWSPTPCSLLHNRFVNLLSESLCQPGSHPPRCGTTAGSLWWRWSRSSCRHTGSPPGACQRAAGHILRSACLCHSDENNPLTIHNRPQAHPPSRPHTTNFKLYVHKQPQHAICTACALKPLANRSACKQQQMLMTADTSSETTAGLSTHLRRQADELLGGTIEWA